MAGRWGSWGAGCGCCSTTPVCLISGWPSTLHLTWPSGTIAIPSTSISRYDTTYTNNNGVYDQAPDGNTCVQNGTVGACYFELGCANSTTPYLKIHYWCQNCIQFDSSFNAYQLSRTQGAIHGATQGASVVSFSSSPFSITFSLTQPTDGIPSGPIPTPAPAGTIVTVTS